MPCFVRAKPSEIEIIEKYSYQTNISGNPSMTEKADPVGDIRVDLPLDGYAHFTRQAYDDYWSQRFGKSWPPGIVIPDLQNIRIGYLAMPGITSEELFSIQSPILTTQPLELDFPVPQENEHLIEDGRLVSWKHVYHPKKPKVDPRPYPIHVQVDIYDERNLYELFESHYEEQGWKDFLKEMSYERSLIIAFRIEVAVPKKFASILTKKPPRLKLMQFEWPMATSHHNLRLRVEPEYPQWDFTKWPQHTLFYFPKDGSVAWNGIDLKPGTYRDGKFDDFTQISPEISFWRLPSLFLEVQNPGEFYEAKTLVFRLEVELFGMLISGAQPVYFDALGKAKRRFPGLKACTQLEVIGDVNVQQRFQNRVLSPHQQLHFDGVILDENRLRDITALLMDKGFEIDFWNISSDGAPETNIMLWASRADGPDFIRVFMILQGKRKETERETVINGGQKYTSAFERGSTLLQMRAELRGDIKKLTRLMNAIHRELKDRFYHVTNLE